MHIECWRNDTDRSKPKYWEKKFTLLTQIPHVLAWYQTVFRGGMPGTDSLIHGPNSRI
jgi:hypothetical protein